ncbi:hypothetical protein [Hymenobacter sp. YC55]|uniref:hypothetical protein n=1 Tax=Hymenobacter sp. YC55 TaxID=3034019 RepID=UPI0023F69E43|nr:hypothetical protein [Hymenobacter sp. YC55]MDF7810691.1 hypothetical protein [Hymenobacter sp. YC55]
MKDFILRVWKRLTEDDLPPFPFDDKEGKEMWDAGKQAHEADQKFDQELNELKKIVKGR